MSVVLQHKLWFLFPELPPAISQNQHFTLSITSARSCEDLCFQDGQCLAAAADPDTASEGTRLAGPSPMPKVTWVVGTATAEGGGWWGGNKGQGCLGVYLGLLGSQVCCPGQGCQSLGRHRGWKDQGHRPCHHCDPVPRGHGCCCGQEAKVMCAYSPAATGSLGLWAQFPQLGARIAGTASYSPSSASCMCSSPLTSEAHMYGSFWHPVVLEHLG